jgi:uncharacterized protein involved in exopolysaccharide biosynthesis
VLIARQQIPEEFVRPIIDDVSIANIDAMLGQVLSLENLSSLIDRLGLFEEKGKLPRSALVALLRENVDAGPLQRPTRGADSIVYEVAYVSPDPRVASRVANALAGLFVQENIVRRTGQAERATSFLREAAQRNEEQLRTVESQISEFRRLHRGELPDELNSNIRKVDTLNTEVASLTQQITVKEDRILSLNSYGGDAALTEDEVLLGELRRELARQTAAHTDEHPNVIALRERIARLQESVSSGSNKSVGSARIVDTERRDISRLQEQRALAQAEIASLNERIDRMPAIAEELSALEQRAQVLREDYLDAERKVQDAELANHLESAQQGAQVSILDSAPVPTSPERPRWLIALGGIGLSGVLALASALLLELFDPVVLGVRQIQRLNSSPILGSLPYVS